MNTILFDLDGTLLSMDLEEFIHKYISLINDKFRNSDFDEKLLVKAIFAGTAAMQKNDGTASNYDVFWDTFSKVSKIEKAEIESHFEAFYHQDFQQIQTSVKVNQHIVDSIKTLKDKGYRLICATNPLFPKIASESRLRWSGVDTSAFEFITTFEDFHYCKPNPMYYEEIFTKYKIDREHCMMVGNDVKEDGAIQALGVPFYLINDHIINIDNQAIDATWHGDSSAFKQVISQFKHVNK